MILESKVAYGDAITNVEAVAGEYVLIYTYLGVAMGGGTLYIWGDKAFSWPDDGHLWITSDTTNTFTFPAADFSLKYYMGYMKFPGLTEAPLLAASNGETFTTDDTRDYILLTAYSDTSSSGNNLGDSITLITANDYMYVYLLAPNTQYQLKTLAGNGAKRNLVYSIPKGILPRYSNKESLNGLKTGDKIIYNKDCSIDFNGYKVLVELYGSGSKRETSLAINYPCSGNGYGGYTKAVLDTSTFDSSLYFSQSGGSSLCYGNSYDAYKRIIVAGDAGERGRYTRGGNGGGTTGGQGGYGGVAGYSPAYNRGATGGTQTGGGQYSSQSSTKGTFTTVGLGKDYNSSYVTGDGGYGWYCGGGGYMSSSSYEYSSGGGSGFVIGQTTTTYPSGYLNGDTALISTLEGSVSEPELVQGVTMDINQRMIVTILETGSSSTQSTIQYYNGTEFIDTHIKYYNGTEFIDCDAYYYDGTEFKKI